MNKYGLMNIVQDCFKRFKDRDFFSIRFVSVYEEMRYSAPAVIRTLKIFPPLCVFYYLYYNEFYCRFIDCMLNSINPTGSSGLRGHSGWEKNEFFEFFYRCLIFRNDLSGKTKVLFQPKLICIFLYNNLSFESLFAWICLSLASITL